MKKGSILWRCTFFVCLGVSFLLAATPRALAGSDVFMDRGSQGTLSIEDIAGLEAKEKEAQDILYISSGEEASPGMIILATIGVLALLGVAIAGIAAQQEKDTDY